MKKWYLPLLFFIPFGVFLRLLSAGFVWDDLTIVPSLAALGNPFVVRGIPWVDGFYRPIAMLSLRGDYLLWKMNPLGFHLTNLIIHGLNVVLLFLLIRRFVGDRAAFFPALLFGIHPAVTEAVGWVSCRFDLLALFFFLLAANSLCSFLEEKRVWLLMLVLIFAACSCLSKETGIAMVFLLPAIVYAKRPSTKKPLLIFAVALGVLMAVGVFALRGKVAAKYLSSGNVTVEGLHMFGLLVYKVVAFNMLTPYSACQLPTLGMGTSVFALTVIGASLIFIVLSVRKSGLTGVGLIWFLLVMIPGVFISLTKGYRVPAADRFLYSAIPGLSFAVAMILKRYAAKGVLPALIVVGLVFAVVSFGRAGVWLSAETLWSDADAKCGGEWSYPIHSLAASALAEGDLAAAEPLFVKLVHGLDDGRLKARYEVENGISLIQGLSSLGSIRQRKDDFRGAEFYFLRADREYARFATEHPKSGKWELAPTHWEMAAFFYADALRQRNAALLSRAFEHIDLAIKNRQMPYDAFRLKAYIQFAMTHCAEAVETLRGAAELAPSLEGNRRETEMMAVRCGR